MIWIYYVHDVPSHTSCVDRPHFLILSPSRPDPTHTLFLLDIFTVQLARGAEKKKTQLLESIRHGPSLASNQTVM
jgi:hypothetical protein